MKSISLLTMTLIITVLTFAQDTSKLTSLQTIGKLDFSLQGIGLTLEQPILPQILLGATVGLGGGYYKEKNTINVANAVSYDWVLFKPAFFSNLNINFYYNRQSRFRKGRSISLNSGDFIAIGTKYTSPKEVKHFIFKEAIIAYTHWGLQRNLGKKFTFQAVIGGGYAWLPTKTDSGTYISLDLKFSYVPFKRP
jgi:hypothetical protein